MRDPFVLTRMINDAEEDLKELRPLAEIGRAFLALPDRTEIWLDHSIPFSAGGLHPILSDKRLYDAVCAALGQTPYKPPR